MDSSKYSAGDRVYVTDRGLAQLREIMRRATGAEPPPNHYGTVDEIWDDGTVLINFDDGGAAPYPDNEVRLLGGSGTGRPVAPDPYAAVGLDPIQGQEESPPDTAPAR